MYTIILILKLILLILNKTLIISNIIIEDILPILSPRHNTRRRRKARRHSFKLRKPCNIYYI